MDKIRKYEIKYTVIHLIIFTFITLNYKLLSEASISSSMKNLVNSILIISGVIITLKSLLLENEKTFKFIVEKRLYYLIKSVELFVIAFATALGGEFFAWTFCIYIMLIVEIVIMSENFDKIIYKLYYVLPLILANIVVLKEKVFNISQLSFVIFQILIILLIEKIISFTLKEFKFQISKTDEIVKKFENNKEESLKFKEAMEEVNKTLEKQKLELEETTEKFRRSTAELYLLKEVSIFIGNILEVKQLVDIVIDILVGVMGVDMCVIALYDERNEVDINIKSVYPKDVIQKIRNKIQKGDIARWVETREIYIDNKLKGKQYDYFSDRKVGSFVAIPLHKNDKTYGIILLEHTMENYFSETSIELFKALSTQITMAIENAKLYEEMEQLAIKDWLTKLYNRVYLQQILPKIFENAVKNNQPVSVSIMDIDHFKNFNDTYGHLFGDKVLQTVATLSKNKIEQNGGIMARYGGEEFIMILPNINSERAAEILEELRKEIEHHELVEGTISTNVTASFGLSSYPELVSKEKDLLKSADDAVYVAKNSGRNRVAVAEKNLN